MKSLPDPAGLYLHIPFCEKKCAYCDFYSAFPTGEMMDNYVRALTEEMHRWGGRFSRSVDSVYLGGGTPSLLGRRIVPLLDAVRQTFSVLPDSEITAEMNPTGNAAEFFAAARQAGVNRISIGVQSGNDDELRLLGRRHTAADARNTVAAARAAGFRNLSLDLMLGLPDSDVATTVRSLDFLLSLHPEHISAYLLKIEPNTLLWARRDSLSIPDEDAASEQYLAVCERLEAAGYVHYEISNFALPGYESRHNTKYWTGTEYLGIGPAAYSFVDGNRFYYPSDLHAFLRHPQTVPDDVGGGAEEYLMLRLRLREGADLAVYGGMSGKPLPETLWTELRHLEQAGLGRISGTRFALTDRGFLVSNSIITDILEMTENENL